MQTVLREAVISFPMFGLTMDPPSSFTLFGRVFYLYGAVVALGFLLGILYCASRTEKLVGITKDDMYDFVLWLIPTAIIGARLYYVLFRLNEYQSFWDIFKVWEGGLAIYGGVIAGALLVYLWCKKRKIPFGALGDLSVYGLLIGQTIGRWGNFLNREAFGRETDIFCRMGLAMPGKNPVYVHPTFLYESLWNLTGFLVLHFYFKKHKRKFDGQITLLYLAWYGLGRALIEGLRTDSLYIGSTGIRVSQLLAAVSCVAAVVTLLLLLRRDPQPELYVDRVNAQKAAEAIQTPPQEPTESASEESQQKPTEENQTE
mgnify:CR=1 FL=1